MLGNEAGHYSGYQHPVRAAAASSTAHKAGGLRQQLRGVVTESGTLRIEDVITRLLEVAGKPGVMSAAGVRAERAMAMALRTYFRSVTRTLTSRLSRLGSESNAETARHAAELTATTVVRSYSHTLLQIISVNKLKAYRAAYKMEHMHEAASDKVGKSAKAAAQYAAESAAQQVTGINQTTVQRFADAVETAIEDQLGVGGLSRALRSISTDMTKFRADMIAATEIADAFGAAALDKLKDEEIEYKQLILSPDACVICESIEAAGPVPVDDSFVDDDGNEYDRSPIHPNCRCATVGARAPENK
jgi:hypothetical protein